jgi:ADP-heptose:LPS heptosyltransferase
MRRERILVIRLGALGDLVQSMGPAAAIRRHHAGAHIVLLTGAAFAELGRAAPYFDEVWVDERPSFGNLAGVLRLRRRLRGGRFDRVYDLQTSDRSGFYFYLMTGLRRRPQWSGIVRFASHRHGGPERVRLHTIDRQREQLRIAGIAETPLPEISWAARDTGRFALEAPFVLLVPGGSAHRPEKRWPIGRYAELARRLAARGLLPVVLGGAIEAPLGAAIRERCPAARDLTGDTGFGEIAGLGRRARRAIGNDTGPMHLLVAAGCPATVLFSAASDPDLTAPRGRDVVVLRRDSLADLAVDEVEATLGPGL